MSTVASPSEPVRVVGVAVVAAAGGRLRVLAARRAATAARGAGGWELPGGKCDPGEPLARAAVREVREELGCGVRVLRTLDRTQRVDDRHVLHVVVADLVDGEPVPLEHDALRWLGPDRLHEVGWLPADVPFLPDVRDVLREVPA